eukprot:CAMPEP_0202381332 /NCGR_PEP_ID=MMETSP1127-20130417/34960_1 /ASSEMBLY_ACC=CAM_ASM_000462 /TAXON_ID=3047 /ORGANISM="Dunaliella tertiolecta, Strain CCMP1320" /LENGTH=438 /DNA_ID=CAMNT_0048980259 /DNA_START=170 /DNA_END=1486 /DNA_ORIENTATION=+
MAAYCACQACQFGSREVLAHSARVAWSALFFLSLVLAWVMRDFAKPLMEKIPWIMREAAHLHLSDEWFGQQAVYRISMGNFVLFTILSLSLLGVKLKADKRSKYLHHGHYLLKLLAWAVFTALPFFFPPGFVDAYGHVAQFGSGIFLIIQMVILLDFIQVWNDAWVAEAEQDESMYYWLLGFTGAAYISSIVLAGLMYHWFNPAHVGACSLNICLITSALLLMVVLTGVSLHPAAKQGSIFPASVISLYCMYLCFSALQSEPKDYECNGLAKQITAASGGTLALGMLVTLASVVYAAFRAGSNSSLFTLEGSEEDEGQEQRSSLLAEEGLSSTSAGMDALPPPGEQEASREGGMRPGQALEDFTPVTYNYSFFHLIFALASMYIAMLMTGWGSSYQELDRIDIGWSSVWIKVAAMWITGLLYCWTLVAHLVFPDRTFA